MTRAAPVVSAWSARARAEAMSKCGARPRYGSTSCDGNGSTDRSTWSSDTPSYADTKKRMSAVRVSTSASVGATSTTGARDAATAANKALAGAVRPLTWRPGTPIPSRPAADFRIARKVSELEV